MSALRASWTKLPTFERVERLGALVDHGFSRRAIARGVGCSEGRVRQLLALQNVTADERQALSEGSLSGKKALTKVQERKVSEWQESVTYNQEQWAKKIHRVVT